MAKISSIAVVLSLCATPFISTPVSAASIDAFIGTWSQQGVTANCRKVNAERVDCRMNVENGGRTFRYTLNLTYAGGKLSYGPDSKGRSYTFRKSGSVLKVNYNVTQAGAAGR
jgi:hypothetical protein